MVEKVTESRALKKNKPKTNKKTQTQKLQTKPNTSPKQTSKPQTSKTPKQKIPENLWGWLFQVAIAVCPALYGHVKDKAQNWKSATDEVVQVN